MGQSGAADPTSPPIPWRKGVPSGGQPTLAGDRVRSQDLVLGTGTLTTPGGGQAQAAAAAVVDAAFVGAHCGGKAGVKRRGLWRQGTLLTHGGLLGAPGPLDSLNRLHSWSPAGDPSSSGAQGM